MRRRAHQIFVLASGLFLLATVSLNGALSIGHVYRLNFTDIDGHHLSTADGRTTVLVLATRADTARAKSVGDRVPDFCLANPNYRMITVLNLTGKSPGIARAVGNWMIRQRLTAESKRLQKRYDARKIARSARNDMFAVADFDGTVTSQLGANPQRSDFAVFVFSRDGKLLHQWNDVPSAEELDGALR